ncbi:MAG: 2-C-methyl-D-erythritol 4-phosphate cytidylyltransferase, partial [Pseudomonadota bacterium]
MRERGLMRVAGIIVAAGRGERAGGELPKQYRMLAGRRVLAWSVAAFAGAKISPIVVMIADGQSDLARPALSGFPDVRTVIGGASRTASVRAGIAALADDAPDVVLIHDAARPGLSVTTVEELVRTLADGAAATAPALPFSDALKRVDGQGAVIRGEAREGL